MKKWLSALFVVFVFAFIYTWNGEESNDVDKGFERSVVLPSKKALKSEIAPVAAKPVKTNAPQKSPSEVAIAVDKTMDSQMAAKFDPKARAPSSLAAYFGQAQLQVNRRQYLVSHELRSLPVEQFENNMGQEIMRENGHVFFETHDNNIGYPSLLNVRSKSIALVTGRVLLKNISQAEANEIAARYGSELDLSMGHLGVYAFSAGSNVLEVAAELGTNGELEIFEGRIREK